MIQETRAQLAGQFTTHKLGRRIGRALAAALGATMALGRPPGWIKTFYGDGGAVIREGFWLPFGDAWNEWAGIALAFVVPLWNLDGKPENGASESTPPSDGRVAVVVMLILMILAGGLLHAGQLGVYVKPVPDPRVTHYRFYADGALIGDVPASQTSTVKGQTVVGKVFDVPGLCKSRSYAARSAFFLNGSWVESAPGPASSSIARPEIASVLLDPQGLRQVVGDNYVQGATIYLDGTAKPTTFSSCQLLTTPSIPFYFIEVTVPGDLQKATYTLPLPPPVAPVTF